MNHQSALSVLAAEMLNTLQQLGQSPTARIDARLWFKHFQRRIKRLQKPKRLNAQQARLNA